MHFVLVIHLWFLLPPEVVRTSEWTNPASRHGWLPPRSPFL